MPILQIGELAQQFTVDTLTGLIPLRGGSRPQPANSLYLTSDFIALMCPYYLLRLQMIFMTITFTELLYYFRFRSLLVVITPKFFVFREYGGSLTSW